MFEDAEFIIYRGAATTLRLVLRDERDEPESLSGAAAARMSIRSYAGADAMVEKDADIDPAASSVEMELSEADTTLLRAGVFLMDAVIEIDGNWYQTDTAYVKVVDALTPVPQ